MKTKISPETRKKFRQIIKFLRWGLLEEQFDMAVVEDKCTSAGCVMGWMPTIFPDQGLHLRKQWWGICLRYRRETNSYDSAASFLGITRSHCVNLLDANRNHIRESPDDTADRLEEYLKTGIAK